MSTRAASDDLAALLEEGRHAGLFSGAAAGVWTPEGRVTAFTGTHSFDDPRTVDATSLFDLASVSKTFTAAVVLRLVDTGMVALDDPVAKVMPVGRGARSDEITLKMLLSHTSGLPAESFLWRDAAHLAPTERLQAVLATELESSPDAQHRYSCLGYIAAGAYAERVAGATLPDLLRQLVTEPLGLTSVGHGPVDRERAVATEDEAWVARGVVRGEVHDELNWFLGGQVGNAGLFGAIDDVLTFAASFLGTSLLSPASLRLATTDQLAPALHADYGQGLGPRIRDRDLFGDLNAFGHGGFTGTLWLAMPERRIAAALLTNRVHPNRDRVEIGPFQRRFSAWIAARSR